MGWQHRAGLQGTAFRRRGCRLAGFVLENVRQIRVCSLTCAAVSLGSFCPDARTAAQQIRSGAPAAGAAAARRQRVPGACLAATDAGGDAPSSPRAARHSSDPVCRPAPADIGTCTLADAWRKAVPQFRLPHTIVDPSDKLF